MTSALWLLLAAAPRLHAEPPAASTAAVPAPQVSSATALPAPAEARPEVVLAYPAPGQQVGAVGHVFVYGSVRPASGTLSIDGEAVPFTERGQFLKFIPVDPGTFTIRALLRLGEESAAAFRDIVVCAPPGPPPAGKAAVLPVSPEADLVLKAGDWVGVAAWAQPGGVMTFRVKGLADDLPMVETPGPDPAVYFAEYLKDSPRTGGYYVGAYRLGAEDRAKEGAVEFAFKHPQSGKAKATAAGRLTADPRFARVAQVRVKLAGTRSGPDAGQLYFFQQGTRLLLDGKAGERWRARLTETEEAWIDDSSVELCPEGAPPPSAKLETIIVRSSDTHADVEFSVGAPVPVVVTQEGDLVKASFYYAREHVNWIVYDELDSFVREVRWRQEGAQKVSAFIHLRAGERLWGYSLRRASDRYVLTLRRAPRAGRKSIFEGLTVVLDPGHSAAPDSAGIGPLLTKEADVNLSMARRVKERLLREKAAVVLTRDSADEALPLPRRTEIAVENNGDVFLSLHFNALPPGVDPRAAPRGFSMYHHQPQSVELARELQLSYRGRLPIPSEGFRFADFHVLRLTEMPSALLESAYIMLPEQEDLIVSPKSQDQLSQAIVEGLWRFLRKNLREPRPTGPSARREVRKPPSEFLAFEKKPAARPAPKASQPKGGRKAGPAGKKSPRRGP